MDRGQKPRSRCCGPNDRSEGIPQQKAGRSLTFGIRASALNSSAPFCNVFQSFTSAFFNKLFRFRIGHERVLQMPLSKHKRLSSDWNHARS
jgi:hypothetical protein